MNLLLACGCHTSPSTTRGGIPTLRFCATHSMLVGLTDILLVALAKNLANQGQASYDVWVRRGEYQIVRSSSRNDTLPASEWRLLAIVSPEMAK
jgi:hypothetical protein